MTEETQPTEEKEESVSKQEPEKPKKNFWQFFTHPVLNFISLILAILGFFFGFYFYYSAKIYPQLIVFVHPVKPTIVKAGQASDIKTFYKDKEINTDVSVAQVVIWNQGKASIKKEQVLKPIVLFTDNNAPILEAAIRKSTREIIQLNLSQDEIQKGRLPISWNILEQSDGGVIQIIYAGDSQTRILLEGVIEGQKHIDNFTIPTEIKSTEEKDIINNSFINRYLPIFAMWTAGIGFMVFGIRNIKKELLAQKRDAVGIILLFLLTFCALILLVVGVFSTYSILFLEKPLPPFNLN
jgi:hypothetical protein